MDSGFLLDVIIRKGSVVFKLLSGEDKSLLIWGDSFLVLDFSFNVVNGICWFNIKSDCLSSESFHEDLHSSSKSED
jgi:hypothetical protein